MSGSYIQQQAGTGQCLAGRQQGGHRQGSDPDHIDFGGIFSKKGELSLHNGARNHCGQYFRMMVRMLELPDNIVVQKGIIHALVEHGFQFKRNCLADLLLLPEREFNVVKGNRICRQGKVDPYLAIVNLFSQRCQRLRYAPGNCPAIGKSHVLGHFDPESGAQAVRYKNCLQGAVTNINA